MNKSICIVLLILCLIAWVYPEEGMWTFDNPPAKLLKEKYNFTVTPEWLDHIRLSSVRFSDGGSGFFVSPNGLVLTNHHVAMGQLQKMSTAQKDYVAAGFYAPKPPMEIPSPDLELNVLQKKENVTAQVLLTSKGKTGEAAVKARTMEIARIEKTAQKKTGLTCEVVPLYRGGEYWLYQYKKYTDVRLVMAPERSIAYFGGDSDNFTYPRYDLDMAFFRVYENGKPIQSPDYLKWNSKGAQEGELVFVSGHPGSTNRLNTYTQLVLLRDIRYPMVLKILEKRLEALYAYAEQSLEHRRRALGQIFNLENSKKVQSGEFQGLMDKELMEKIRRSEEEFSGLVTSNPEWKQKFGTIWDKISSVVALQRETLERDYFQEKAFFGRLPEIAKKIVLYVSEIKKPDGERLEGFHDSELDQFRFNLFSPAPIYPDLEAVSWETILKLAINKLGPEDPYLKIILQGKSPTEAVSGLLSQTRLMDVTVRKKLLEGGKNAVSQCQDPLIVMARALEPLWREKDKWNKEKIAGVLIPAGEKLALARFAVFGKASYPDATFTLRLSYGTVKGFPMNGTVAPYKTTLFGLFDRSLSFDQKGDFSLPQRFWERKDQLDLSTPVNFACTCDVIGGNSGSPVINTQGEMVGLVFDGNIESLVGRFFYDIEKNRTVSVHSAYILEALRKLYDASLLIEEIEGKK